MEELEEKQSWAVYWIMAGLVGLVGVLAMALYIFLGADVTRELHQAGALAAYEAGQRLEAQGRPDAALQRYRQALEEQVIDDALRYRCLLAMGDVLAQQQRFAEAIECYEEVPAPEYLLETDSLTQYLNALAYEQQLVDALKTMIDLTYTTSDDEASEHLFSVFRYFTDKFSEYDIVALLQRWLDDNSDSPQFDAAQRLYAILAQ